MSDWQTIETAPIKEKIDLWSPTYGRCPDSMQMAKGHFWDNSYRPRRIYDPTHWMPLPNPPKETP